MERYKTQVVNDILESLKDSERNLVNRIRDRLDDESFTRQRLERLLEDIKAITKEGNQVLRERLRETVKEFGEREAKWTAGAIGESIPIEWNITQPSPSQIYAAVVDRPLEDRMFDEAMRGVGENQRQRIQAALRRGFTEGQTVQEIVRSIRGTRKANYTDGILGRSRRETTGLVRTAINHTHSVARDELVRENRDLIKGVQWVATLDSRTTLICASRDGKVYDVDEGPRPPAHWNCLPGDGLVLSRSNITGVSKRWFDGELIVVRTASGRKLFCTPNHPILTGNGFLPAQSLDFGSKVVCDGVGQWPANAVDGDGKNRPALIQDIAESFLESSEVVSSPVPTTAEDFHGDGIDGQVAIVGSHRSLVSGAQPAFSKQPRKLHFKARDIQPSILSSLGGFTQRVEARRSALGSFVRSANKFFSFLGAGLCHTSELLLASAAQFDTVVFQNTFNRSGRAVEMVCNTPTAGSGLVHS
ncbi:MAG: minor capsid protein, partial [Rhodothermales bacterium]